MKKTILKFTAPWCHPCQTLEPYLKQAAAQGLEVVSIDIDKNPDAAYQNQISGVPTLVFLVDDKVVDRTHGATEKVIQKIREFSAPEGE